MRPLEGIKVLDFSRVVAGPYAGRMLADLGADVVKVEPPEGDLTRLWGEDRNGITGFYQQQNAGKRNICIDMRAEGSVALAIELASKADIVIENYRAGVMDRMGLGWPVLSAVNPGLIMVAISGFGQGGPDSGRPAFAPVVEAEGGLTARQSHFDQAPPTDPILSIADYYAGLHGLVGVLAALHARATTGAGTYLDIAMIDAILTTDDYIHHAIDQSPTVRLGGEYRRLPEGGWILVSGQFKHLWVQLTKFKVVADPAPKEADLDTKIRLRKEAADVWWSSLKTDAEATASLNHIHVAWGVMRTPEEAVLSATAKHRGTVAQVDDRGGGVRGVINSPYHFSNYESGVTGGGRFRGEDNAEVLTDWLAADLSRIGDLLTSGVLLS